MQLFNTTHISNIIIKKHLPLSILFVWILLVPQTIHSASLLYPEIRKQSVGIESYALNIFCTETIDKKYLKAISGSGVFLSDPTQAKSIILTNAHVARHLLDKNKSCTGRTGSPAVTTHRLTLRYIPSFWLQTNGSYVIGDPNKDSTGEFDFAIIEAQKIEKFDTKKKTQSVYDIFKPTLHFQLKEYEDKTTEGSIFSYPAQKTLSKNIFNPLYVKQDNIQIREVYNSPTYQESDSLLDTQGSLNIDHGSSGGMVLLQNISNNLIGLSSILIQENNPQIVRVVTLKHVFSIINKDLGVINSSQSEVFSDILKTAQKQKISDESIFNIFKNNKLTALLELQTRKTLLNLGISTK
jgi:hypothetical protein